MRTLHTFLCAALAMLATSCFRYPTPYRAENGKIAYATQVGGKIIHTINADGSMAVTSDMEISLQHAFQAAVALGVPLIDYLTTKITETTAQLANANLTGLERLRLQNDLAKFQAQLGAAERLKSQGIGAGATLGPVTFD